MTPFCTPKLTLGLFLLFLGPVALGADSATFVDDRSAATSLMADVRWTGGGDGKRWVDKLNWSGGSLPGESDHVIIESGVVEFSGNHVIAKLTVNGGGTLNMKGGALEVSSASVIGGNGTVLHEGGTLAPVSGLAIEGTYDWKSGALGGTATLTGSMLMDGPGNKSLTGSLTNLATITWTGGPLYIYDDQVLDNQGTMVVDVETDVTVIRFAGDGPWLFKSTGTLIKRGSAEMRVTAHSELHSIVDVEDGLLDLRFDSILDRTAISVATDATILLSGGTHVVKGTVTGAPEGSFASTASLQADPDGGTLDLGGSGLEMRSGYVDGDRPLVNIGTLRAATTGSKSLRGGLTNEGHLIWEDGPLYIYDDQVLLNTGLMTLRPGANQVIHRFGGDGPWILRSTGKVEKEGPSKVTITANTDLGSEIDVKEGVLALNFDSVLDNTEVSVAAGAELLLALGNHVIKGTITGSPEGAFATTSAIRADPDGGILDLEGSGFEFRQGFVDGELPLVNAGILRATSVSAKSLRGSLTNEGQLIWEDGPMYIYEDQALLNTGSMTINPSANQVLHRFGGDGPWVFRSTGELTKLGEREVAITAQSEITGTIDVLEGALKMNYDSRWIDPEVYVGEGATLNLATGVHTVDGTISGDPDGVFSLSGTRILPAAGGGSFDLGGAGFQYHNGFLSGDQPLVNVGRFRFITAGSKSIDDGGFTNRGMVEWEEGPIYIYDEKLFYNAGEFRIVGDKDRTLHRFGGDGPWRFENRGSVVHEGSGTTRVTAEFENGGLIDVTAGHLDLTFNSRMEDGSRVSVASGSTLSLSGGESTFSGGISASAEGDFVLAGSNIRAISDASIATSGLGLQWSGGYLTSGELTNNGLIDFVGASAKRGVRGEDALLRNDGQIEFTGDGIFYIYDGGRLENDSEFHLSGNAAVRGWNTEGLFVNGPEAKLSKSADNAVTVGTDIRTRPSFPLLAVRLDGMVQLEGQVDFAGSSVEDAALHAIASEGTGLLEVAGVFGMGPESDLQIGIGGLAPGVDHDRLDVAASSSRIPNDGVALLNGTLSVDLVNGFKPSDGQSFAILSAEEIRGGFANRDGLTLEESNLSLYPSVEDAVYTLTAMTGIPTVSGTIASTPDNSENGSIATVTVTGTDFAPDIRVELVCEECVDPENSGVIVGQVLRITPTEAVITLDLGTGDVFGQYNLVVSDPRGGSAQTAFEVSDAPPLVGVRAVDSMAGEAGRDQGLFAVTTSRPVREAMQVEFTLSGTATEFRDYVTDVIGGVLDFEQGANEVFVSVNPLNDAESESSESVTLQLAGNGPFEGAASATVTISDGPPSAEFDVLGSEPSSAGSRGVVTVSAYGQGVSEDATIRLIGGDGTLVPVTTKVEPGGTVIRGSFVMDDVEEGSVSIEVESDGEKRLLRSVLEIVEPVYPEVFVQILAPIRVPRTRQRTYTVVMRNRGNVDVMGFASVSGIPEDVEWSIDESAYELKGAPGLTWYDVAPRFTDEVSHVFSLPRTVLRAGETKRIEIYAAIETPQTMRLLAAWTNYR